MAIELVKDMFFYAIVCSDINPESPNAFDMVDEELKSIYNGTDEHPWKTLREITEPEWEKYAPVQCTKHANKWHYVCEC